MTSSNPTPVLQGTLFRYVPERFLKRGYWKASFATLTEDGHLLLHKDESPKSKQSISIDLSPIVLYLAFGEDAEKFSPPKLDLGDNTEKTTTGQKGLHVENLIAVPHDKNCQQITWLCASDQTSLRAWLRTLSVALRNKGNPPCLTMKRGDEELIGNLCM